MTLIDTATLATTSGAELVSSEAFYAENASRMIPAGQIANLVVISGAGALRTATTLATRYPAATVHVLGIKPQRELSVPTPMNVRITLTKSVEQIHAALRLVPTVDLIIDELGVTNPYRVRIFRECLYYLRDGGRYVMRNLRGAIEVVQEVNRVAMLRHDPDFSPTANIGYKAVGPVIERDPNGLEADKRLAAAIERVSIHDDVLIVGKRYNHFLKLREEELDAEFLAARMQNWATEETIEAAATFVSRANLTNNTPQVAHWFPKEFETPALKLRTYQQVLCMQRQRIGRDNILLPDTFRLLRRTYLKHDFLQDVDARFARVDVTTERVLHGSYYYLDTEYPHVYGHLVTDMVGRLWGWDIVKQRDPNTKLLVSVRQADGGVMKPWMRAMLNAYGISDADIVVLDGPAWVETVHAATPQFTNFAYAHPSIQRVWDKLRDALLTQATFEAPAKVFLTRAPGGARECNNGAAVEQVFADAGFTLLRPELLSLPDQVALFVNTKVLAGWGGSGMLNSIFANGPKRKLILNPDSHGAINEYLIAAIHGDDINYIYSQADDAKAYQSTFTFDFGRDGDTLAAFVNAPA